MDRYLAIVISSLIAAVVYLFFVFITKSKNRRKFLTEHQIFFHPNAICVWRTLLGWFGLNLYFSVEQYFLGILCFCISAVLDGVDGLVARNCKLETRFGEEFDPLCDKLTYLPAMLIFAYHGRLDVILIWILIFIEFFGQFFVRKIAKNYGLQVAANNFGKIKAVLCFGVIIYCAILDDGLILPDFTEQIIWLCIILSAASGGFKLIQNRYYADILSTLNLLCGIGSIYLILQDRFILAALAILAGQIFDLFDGRMVEKHGGTNVGPWLDDVADFISFGVSPALFLMFSIGSKAVSILYLASVGFRLGRFLFKDKKDFSLPYGEFNGLPSPAGAMIVLGACLVKMDSSILTAVITLTSLLLVSKIRFVHFGKFVLKRVPSAVFILAGSGMFVLFAYLIKERSPVLFGAVLLSISSIYIFFGNSKIAKKII